jgi:hypothetical protein
VTPVLRFAAIVAACQEAGFAPKICAFEDPPVNPMLARLASGREVGLAPDLSILWPTNDPSPVIASVLATARRCAERHRWLRGPIR